MLIKNCSFVNLFGDDEYNSYRVIILNGGINMFQVKYCPVTGKKVRVVGDYTQNNKVTFSDNKAVCPTEKGKCSGNCITCNLV